MTTDTLLSLRQWTVDRRSVAIGPLDLDLRSGEIVTVMGPSGVGKTTLLMTILGYQEGGLALGGLRVGGNVELNEGAIPEGSLYIPQSVPFNPNWEVESFLCRLPWGQRSILDRVWPVRLSRARVVRDVLAKLDLSSRRRATVSELSGGECQRAALAQLLLLKPRLLVGDEFVSALDPGMTVWVLDAIRKALGEGNGAALLALHDVHAALHISTRIILLWPGSVCRIPWVLSLNKDSWDADKLHTALCIARWIGDSAVNDGIVAMLSLMRRVFENHDTMHATLAQFSENVVVEVDGHGRLIPSVDGRVEGLDLSHCGDHEPGIRPIQARGTHLIATGFCIPRASGRPLCIVAKSDGPSSGV